MNRPRKTSALTLSSSAIPYLIFSCTHGSQERKTKGEDSSSHPYYPPVRKPPRRKIQEKLIPSSTTHPDDVQDSPSTSNTHSSSATHHVLPTPSLDTPLTRCLPLLQSLSLPQHQSTLPPNSSFTPRPRPNSSHTGLRYSCQAPLAFRESENSDTHPSWRPIEFCGPCLLARVYRGARGGPESHRRLWSRR